jgi:excisionase family DNA binding protein
MAKRFLRVPEAAKAIGIPVDRAREMAALGLIPTVRLTPGGRRLVPRAALESWLDSLDANALASVRRSALRVSDT